MDCSSRFSLRLTVLAIMLVSGHASGAAPDTAASLDRSDSKWRTGPVRYILGKDEEMEFRKLKTDEERGLFIAAFWSKRDPSPGTDSNEFKELFAKRIEVANQRFAPPDGRGWEEDRGKVLMLLGPPDEVEIIEGGGGEGGDGTVKRNKARFIYRHEVVPGAPNPLALEFIPDTAGGFRLLDKFGFSHPRLTGLDPVPVPMPVAAVKAAPAPIAPSLPEAAPIPAEAEPPPTPAHLLMEEILGGPTPPQKIPLAIRVDTYKKSDGGAFATLTVAVKKSASNDAAPILAARVTAPDETVLLRLEKEDVFKGADENSKVAAGGDLHFQAGGNLNPGKYSLIAAAKDPATGDIGFVMKDVEVPDFHDAATLQMSTVTLARKVERLTAPADAAVRFVVGNFKVLPAPRPSFKAGEDIWLYFQVYNTASDPANGQPKLKISYAFGKVEKTKVILLGGKPIEQNTDKTVQSYAISVMPQWPAGDYQVVVKVDDLVAATSISQTVPFRVEKP